MFSFVSVSFYYVLFCWSCSFLFSFLLSILFSLQFFSLTLCVFTYFLISLAVLFLNLLSFFSLFLWLYSVCFSLIFCFYSILYSMRHCSLSFTPVYTPFLVRIRWYSLFFLLFFLPAFSLFLYFLSVLSGFFVFFLLLFSLFFFFGSLPVLSFVCYSLLFVLTVYSLFDILIELWQPEEECFWPVEPFSKLKTTFGIYWMSIKVKISMAWV